MSLVRIDPLKTGKGEPRIEVQPRPNGPLITAEGGMIVDITNPQELARVLQIPGCSLVDPMATRPPAPPIPERRGPGRPRRPV